MRKYLVSGLILAALFTVSCSSKKDNSEASVAANKEKVRVEALKKQNVNRIAEYPTSLSAYEENHLAPATPGRIEKINVEIGTRVAKGQVLVQMDRTQLHQAQVQLKNLEADFKRFDILNKEGNIAKQQYDQMKTQLEIAKSNVEFLTENTQLRAPFSGVISGKYFEQGEMYSGSPMAAGKAAIVSLVQINQLKAIVSIPESFFPKIKMGMVAKVTSDIYPDKNFSGKINRIYPTIDPQTRTFQVEIVVPNSGEVLRPGMFGRISLDLGSIAAMLVPANAVLKLQGSNERYLFIVKDGKAKRVSVALGQRSNDMLEVSSTELAEGDMVVVSGQGRLIDGVDVDVVQ